MNLLPAGETDVLAALTALATQVSAWGTGLVKSPLDIAQAIAAPVLYLSNLVDI